MDKKKVAKSWEIGPGGGPGAKTVIFLKSCSRVYGSSIFEARKPRKLSRNSHKTLAEGRLKAERVSGALSEDFGLVLELKKEPKIKKEHTVNEAKKRREKGPKRDPNLTGRGGSAVSRRPGELSYQQVSDVRTVI